jgi:dTDP-4-dehydrorhamnose 3,5-epimerase-like enzyme
MPHDILAPAFERTDERGLFREILNGGSWESLISGRMNPGAVLGNHYHRKTTIFFYLAEGSARIRTVDVETRERDDLLLHAGHGVMLRTNESHAIRFLEEAEFLMLKSLKYDPTDPDTFDYPVED